jgi:hypothetical protein
MLEAIPFGFFAKDFQLTDDGSLVGELETSMFREKARLELQDATYELYREGGFRGDFLAARDGKVVARARKPSVWTQDFDVELGTRRVTLTRPSRWKRAFAAFQSGKQIGTITPTSVFTRRGSIEFSADLSAFDRAFLFWLCLLMWKRQSTAGHS